MSARAYRIAIGVCSIVVGLATVPTVSAAQRAADTDSLLTALRHAADMVPGALPREVRALVFKRFTVHPADLVDGAPGDSVTGVNAVFQIVFAQGWLMVDAGLDRALAGSGPGFSDEQHARVVEALRGARLIVVTHEHEDHIAGVIQSPFAAQLAARTILTRAQVKSLIDHPSRPEIRLDSARASKYLQVDYENILPIAPGVVLLKAPGHTPGSQMVYVRLAAGRELILAGDVAWLMAGVELQRQKPDSVSRELGEDRAALASQLAWLHGLRSHGVVVVPAHDGAAVAARATGSRHHPSRPITLRGVPRS